MRYEVVHERFIHHDNNYLRGCYGAWCCSICIWGQVIWAFQESRIVVYSQGRKERILHQRVRTSQIGQLPVLPKCESLYCSHKSRIEVISDDTLWEPLPNLRQGNLRVPLIVKHLDFSGSSLEWFQSQPCARSCVPWVHHEWTRMLAQLSLTTP